MPMLHGFFQFSLREAALTAMLLEAHNTRAFHSV